MADRQRIVQVLNNLVSNAARHAPESSPIRVTAARDGVHVAVSVSDEARGVPPDRLPLLFHKRAGFAGGDPARGAGRFGLGLAICKRLVEAYWGRIWPESEGAGLGTRFTITIPVADEASDGATAGFAPDRDVAPREGRGRTRILVLDDDCSSAAELARVSVWMGEIRWMRRNGSAEARNPILKPLDTIECRTRSSRRMTSSRNGRPPMS